MVYTLSISNIGMCIKFKVRVVALLCFQKQFVKFDIEKLATLRIHIIHEVTLTTV